MKKFLSIILAILMIVTSVPFAFAADSFAITHQPTAEEDYVTTNDANATYQWYKWCEPAEGYVIDSLTATPFDPDAYFGSTDDYQGQARYIGEDRGWSPEYRKMPNGVHEMYYFEVSLKKGETITFDFDLDESLVAYFLYGTGSVDITVDGRTGTYTADNAGDYALAVRALQLTAVRATSDGKGYKAIEGETSAQLKNVEDGERYVCYVTYSDGTVAVSDEVKGHAHTGTELTCMGYKCTICGRLFGEETGDHSFTSFAVIVEPTYKLPGTEKAVCDYGCGAEATRQIPALKDKAEVDVVYDENGNRVGFESIKVKATEYYDIFGGDGGAVEDLSVGQFYKKVLTSNIPHTKIESSWLPVTIYQTASSLWGNVAADVFKAAGRGYGWNWEFGNKFDEYYGVATANKENGVYLAEQLGNTEPLSKGDLEDNCVRGTGLQAYSSLNLVQEVMLDQIVDVCGERNDAEAFKKVVLEFCTDDEEGFELFKNKDEQVVLANIITNLRVPAALQRQFSTFGVVYYDFELTPVIEENLQYITAADNYESIKDAFNNKAPGVSYIESNDGSTSMSYIQNPTSAPASVSASSSKSTTTSVSSSFSESENHSFSESIKINAGVKLQEVFNVGVEVGFSASQAIGTSYSESTSLSETVSTSSSASVTLPAYTELGIKQSMSKVEQSVEYSCPVYVTYKVAVFGVNAQYIQDANTGSWSITNYDQGCIFTTFGSDSKVGGITATENLYNRWNEKSKAFELSYGNTYGMWEDQNDGNPPLKVNYIDWSKLGNELDAATSYLKYNIPMSSMGGTMIFKTDSYNTEITQIYPMYDLKRVKFEGNGAYTLGIGGKLDLNTVNVIGLNKFDQPYYGFLGRMGAWHLCDKDGNDLPAYEAGKGITIEATPTTQTIIANELGDYYLRFDIDEEYYTKAADRQTYITNDDLEMTAIMKLSVTDTGNNHTCRPGGWITYIPANCVVEGERYRNCLTCSKRLATEVIPKADHVPVEVVTSATCTTDGSKTTTCLTCKAIISNEVIPAKGHGKTYSVTTVTPTCTRDGEKALYCLDCNNLVGSETTASTGHDNGVWKIDFEATPEHEGQMTKYCSSCNYALESKTFAYHTHSYTAWGTNSNGTHTRSCYLCSFTETANCDYDETVTPATCTADGKTTYQCKACKHKYSETSSYAQGHSWGAWAEIDSENHGATCTVCGESEATAHIFVEYIPNNDATKDADGTKTATCVVCEAKDTVIDEGSKLVDPDADEPADDPSDNPAEGCDHMCHNTGVTSIFWKIIRFFWKLFKMNPVCECGAAHY